MGKPDSVARGMFAAHIHKELRTVEAAAAVRAQQITATANLKTESIASITESSVKSDFNLILLPQFSCRCALCVHVLACWSN